MIDADDTVRYVNTSGISHTQITTPRARRRSALFWSVTITVVDDLVDETHRVG